MRDAQQVVVESSWNVMEHGDAREGKWKGNSRMEWVASTLHTTSEHGESSITTADAHTSAASGRLNWRTPADLNGLVRFAEGRNLVSARVPSHFNWHVLSYLAFSWQRDWTGHSCLAVWYCEATWRSPTVRPLSWLCRTCTQLYRYFPINKLTVEQATKTQRGSRSIAVLFLQSRP